MAQKVTGASAPTDGPSTDAAAEGQAPAPAAPATLEKAEAAEATAPKDPETVRYVGTADVRSIDEAGWANVHDHAQKPTEWSAANGFELPASDFLKTSLEYLAGQPDFQVL